MSLHFKTIAQTANLQRVVYMSGCTLIPAEIWTDIPCLSSLPRYSPEALIERKFTKKSDIWSYGVLMWEIFTHGKNPILKNKNGVYIDPRVTAYWLKNGLRLRKELHWPERLYDIMMQCWELDPEKRQNLYWIIANLRTVATEHQQRQAGHLL